jgi:hypothetical protein
MYLCPQYNLSSLDSSLGTSKISILAALMTF